MLGLTLEVERTGIRCDLLLHFLEVYWINRKDYTWGDGMLGGVDHARRCVLILDEEWTLEHDLAA